MQKNPIFANNITQDKKLVKLRQAICTLADGFASQGKTEAAEYVRMAGELLLSMGGDKKEYCFPNEIAGAIALIVSSGTREHKVFLVTAPEHVPHYNALLEEILTAWGEISPQGLNCQSLYSGLSVCDAASYKDLLEKKRLPTSRRTVYSRASQTAVYPHTTGAFSEWEVSGTMLKCELAFAQRDPQWKDAAVELIDEIRGLAGDIFAMAAGDVNDSVIMANVEGIYFLTKKLRELCFDGICARDRGPAASLLADLICKLIAFMKPELRCDVVFKDGWRTLVYRTNPLATPADAIPISAYRTVGSCPLEQKDGVPAVRDLEPVPETTASSAQNCMIS